MWWWMVAAALAGEIVVGAAEPIVVQVDGQVVPFSARRQVARAVDLAGGVHVVEVLNPLGRPVARVEVDVPVEGQVWMQYARRQLTVLETPQLDRRGRPEAPVVEEDVFEVGDDVPTVGAVLVAGVAGRSGRVWLGGRVVPYAPGDEGFVAGNLAPGHHALRVEDNGRVRYDGRIEVRAGSTRRCLPQLRGRAWELDCHWVDGVVGVLEPEPVPAEPEPEQGPVAMSPGGYAGLLGSVESASFSSDKLNVLRTAASHHHFTIVQLAGILDALSHSSDKVQAVRILRPRIVDPDNAHLLDDHLSFSSDRDAVQALFR